ncbi:MAG: helix-turn-helix domain-containing protein [Bacteroidetes bacterium]|nr:helix-turn-helix domain-containing protein [Bacteroidota bacterium]
MIRIVPQQFYENPDIKKIFVDGLSCVIHKRLDEPTYGKEGFVSTHVITYVRQGVLRVENDEGLHVEVTPGKMVFMPKGLYTISDIMPKGGHFDAMMFFIEPEVIQQFLESLNYTCSKEKSISNILIEGNEQTRFFADSLLQLYTDIERPNRQLTKMKLFELLHLIHHSYEDKNCFAMALSTLNNKEKKSLREFMQANFHKSLSIEDYAYLTGRSISTFTRDFKSKFDGVAPKQWLIEQRLEKARQLLVKNHINSITDVAWESGYENIPHFIKEFHKRYGITPKQFLIENRQGAFV